MYSVSKTETIFAITCIFSVLTSKEVNRVILNFVLLFNLINTEDLSYQI